MHTTDFYCDLHGPIVESRRGKLRGFYEKGLYKFRGIPYAKAKRFHSPEPVDAWDGVKDCLCYGYTCPTIHNTSKERMMIMLEFRYWPQDEDCLNLNVFTQNINNDVKKPVMVFIHGGAFANGSSIEHLTYEPENLVKDEDVVLVSLNHRLNILGYFNLAEYGEQYHNSVNLGMEDIVAALKWVKENIAKFGGDPDNVTIFGQSGGGMKCTVLMQTPSTEGLYQKAILESGVTSSTLAVASYEDGLKVADAVIKELGLTKETISDIEDPEKYPYEKLRETFLKVEPGLLAAGVSTFWSPAANDWYMGDPRTAGPTDLFRKTPIIAGTAIAETAWFNDVYPDPDMSQEEKLETLRARYGADTERLLELFRKAYPEKDDLDYFYFDTLFRKGTIEYLDCKSEAGGAPIYSYMLSYDFKVNGRVPAWHAADHPLVFKSYEMCPVMQDENCAKLSDQIAGSWAAFAHSGDPNNDDLTCEWKPYRKGDGEYTYIFDKENYLRDGYDRELVDETMAVYQNKIEMTNY